MSQVNRTEDLGMKSPKKQKFWVDWDSLQKYNFILFIVHIILTVVIWIYLNNAIDPNKPMSEINLDLFDHIFVLNPDEDAFTTISQKAQGVSEQGLANMIASFFAVTAGFHLLYALNPNNIYLDAVENGNNYLRWLEYGISATIMIVIIAILSGVKDIKTYFVLTTAAIGMIATGQWFETSSGNARWIPLIVGFILLSGIFASIYTSFNDRVNDSRNAGEEVPGWLWAVVIVMGLFYASFGIVPIAQIFFKGDYRRYEFTYLTLSLMSKATLGILVSYGFGQRLNAEEMTVSSKLQYPVGSSKNPIPASVSYRDSWDF